MKLGAGRATKDDMIDMAVGVVLDKKVGDSVGEGDVLAYIHANRVDNEEAIAYIQKAYCICKDPVCPPTLIYDVIA